MQRARISAEYLRNILVSERPEQSDRDFAEILECIFLKGNWLYFDTKSLNLFHKVHMLTKYDLVVKTNIHLFHRHVSKHGADNVTWKIQSLI